MIRLSLTRADASVTETETLTAGRVGLECAFTFSADWDGLEKVAVFEGAETIEVALGTANVAVVPPECMATAGYNLRCGAYGMSATQAIVIPTVWAKAGKIKDSASPDEETLADFTPTLAAQVIAKADSAEETANTIAERASRGEFDGFSPYVAVEEITNGHRVSITDSAGTNEFNVMDGADGANGDSPTIAVSDITGGHVLTITDINGTRTVNVLNGEDGAAGADGYSPTVTVTDITGGHRVTITDLNGNHTFDVMDGEDGEGGSSITVDSALSDSSTNPVQNKVVKAALDTIDGSFLKNSLAIVQAPPAIGSMLKVAESYFDQAYGSNTHLVYDSGHGLFAPSTTSSVEGEEGYPAIVCSQFAQALMKGIRYAQSRYVLANNHIAGWGWTTDGSGTYADFGTPVNDDASKDYMDARHQLKYALDHGWAYTISDVRKQIRPGDFIFYGLANVSTWEDVTHVALVLHVGLDDDYMITIESDDQTVSGKRVGVVTKRFAIEKKGGHYLFGARFPVFDGASPDMVGSKILEDSALTGTNTAYMIKQYDTPSIMPAGFYTAIIDGDFAASRVEIGVRYADAAANTFDYSNGRMVKNAGRYAVTFYAAKPFVQVRVGATANNAYIINRWALFKGYFGQDWNLDPDVPTAADVGAIPVPTSATAGQFLVYNGTAWVAQTLATWQGGNY